MTNDVELVPREETLALRELHRKEMDCQIILDSWHGRGWVDSYLLRIDGRVAGYGLVGGVRDEPRETVTEFYVLPAHRGRSLPLFRRFVEASGARSIEVQSNDLLLTLMLYDCARGSSPTSSSSRTQSRRTSPPPGLSSGRLPRGIRIDRKPGARH